MPNYNAETLAAMRESNELAHDPNVRTYSVEEAFATLTDSDLDAEIQRGLDDVSAGRTRPCPKQTFPDPIALKGDLPSLNDFDAAKKARRK